ncbi:MAG: hypothetical protein ACOCWH_02035 [Spirochaetota bacterium]
MVTSANNTYQLPDRISFGHIAQLYDSFHSMMQHDPVVFDLTRTKEVHAAFVGFLIYLKTEKEKRNGSVRLIISPTVEQILNTLQLDDYFGQNLRSA